MAERILAAIVIAVTLGFGAAVWSAADAVASRIEQQQARR